MGTQKTPRSVGTHDGAFHADEVTACALLLLFGLVDQDKIVRTRDLKVLAMCEFVCDVGGLYDPSQKLFDHHQVEYQGSFSSAGMVLLYLQSQALISSREYQFFNELLVLGVDAHDNGRDPQVLGLCTYSHIISSFNPVVNEASVEQLEAGFHEALNFALSFLERSWQRYQYIQSCRELVADTMNTYRDCLIFERNIPWMDAFFELDGERHPARFVIMPADQHWKLRGIPPNHEKKMQVRQPLPKQWAGLLDADLKRVTGIPGAIFCHKGRFISVWETRQDAIQALNMVLNEERS